jgi:DNA-binding Lrp family transcriptional regulator
MNQPARTGRDRVGSDEAKHWARKLYVGGVGTKAILNAICNYVISDGRAFCSVSDLAQDTDQSISTARRRLHDLEDLGVIVRFARAIDDSGRVNSGGATRRADGPNCDLHGRRIDDEIRLMMDIDPAALRAAAEAMKTRNKAPSSDAGEDDDERAAPSNLEGPNVAAAPVILQGPAPSTNSELEGPPFQQVEGLKENNSKKDSPLTPLTGGERAIDEELERDIEAFREAYPAPITDMPRFRTVFNSMGADERDKVITAAKGYRRYITDLERKGRGRNVKNAHIWVANGLWQGYVTSGEKAVAAALITQAPVDSETGKAWATAHRIAHVSPLESAGRYYIPRPLTPQELALAQAPAIEQWIFIEAEQANQCGAWRSFLRDVLADRARPELVWDRNPGGRRGFMAPWPWPPKRDGSLCQTAPPEVITEQDAAAFK